MSLDALLDQIREASEVELEAIAAAERALKFGGRQKILRAIAERRLVLAGTIT